ncbi:MAG: hypothetical protein K8R68_01435, partial [Bacteroidales bacterium]|nr:hypothetical protein [Bacteroidales bacterium]
HVRIYQNNGGTWTQIGADIDGEATNNQSGYSVSLSSDGSVVAIGTPFNDGNGFWSGHVRIYRMILTNISQSTIQPNILIYPNPTNGNIHFEFDNKHIQQI